MSCHFDEHLDLFIKASLVSSKEIITCVDLIMAVADWLICLATTAVDNWTFGG